MAEKNIRAKDIPEGQGVLPGFAVRTIAAQSKLRIGGPDVDESLIVNHRGERRSAGQIRRMVRPERRLVSR